MTCLEVVSMPIVTMLLPCFCYGQLVMQALYSMLHDSWLYIYPASTPALSFTVAQSCVNVTAANVNAILSIRQHLPGSGVVV